MKRNTTATTTQTRTFTRYRTLGTHYTTRESATRIAELFWKAGHDVVVVPDFKRFGIYRIRLYIHGVPMGAN